MIKAVLLILSVIWVMPDQVSARDKCAMALLHPHIESIKGLSHEDQDMILMASLIASQLQPTASIIQINPTLIFLGAITEVKIGSKDKGVFHNFSLIDRTLFTVLKHLGILEETQAFLLSQLGFNETHLGPFSIKDDGGLILHLNSPPTISVITHFDYDKTAGLLLNVVDHSKQNEEYQNTHKKSPQSLSAFSEHFLLAILDLDIPSRETLFDTFNTKDAMKIKSALQSLFNDIKSTVKSPREILHQLILDKDAILQEAILLTQEGISIEEAAKKLEVNKDHLQYWLDKHKEEYNRQHQRKTYSQEQKDEITQEVIKLFQEEKMTIIEAARRVEVKKSTLQYWLNKHEQKYGPIPGRQKRTLYSQEQKNKIIRKAISLIQQGMNLVRIAKILKVNYLNLRKWLYKHQKEHGPIPRRKQKAQSHSEKNRNK